MLGERAGEECSGDRGRQAGSQAGRQTDRQKRDRETALCLELALAAGSCIFLDFSIGSESNVRHWQGVTQVTIRHALPGGCGVRSQHFWVLDRWLWPYRQTYRQIDKQTGFGRGELHFS
jgi:hypothetical protein